MENSNIRIRRKVQLREKESEPQQNNPVTTAHQTTQAPHNKNSKTWIWALLALVVIGIIGFALLHNPNKNAVETPAITEQPSTTIDEKLNNRSSDIENAVSETVTTTEEVTEPAAQQPAADTQPSEPKQITESPAPNANNISNDIEAEAKKVIRGDYGIGKTRKDKLGEKYQIIQNRVNQLKREGAF